MHFEGFGLAFRNPDFAAHAKSYSAEPGVAALVSSL